MDIATGYSLLLFSIDWSIDDFENYAAVELLA
jgi:hypothetical protein